MFESVQNFGGKANCQENPGAFKTMRKSAHSVQSQEFLLSYLQDLINAEKDGRNFMTEKYALMDNLIPELSQNALIPLIIQEEYAWMNEASSIYPHVIRKDNVEQFTLYLSCELQTLSEKSLELYYKNIKTALEQNRNLTLERYEYIMQALGYGSLQNYEKQFAEQ